VFFFSEELANLLHRVARIAYPTVDEAGLARPDKAPLNSRSNTAPEFVREVSCVNEDETPSHDAGRNVLIPVPDLERRVAEDEGLFPRRPAEGKKLIPPIRDAREPLLVIPPRKLDRGEGGLPWDLEPTFSLGRGVGEAREGNNHSRLFLFNPSR
jgi:hypothetical protein